MRLLINVNGAATLVSDFEGQSQLLNSYRQTVQRVKNNCPCSGTVRGTLIRTLNEIINEMDNERNLYGVLGQVLEQNISCYRTFEENIAQCDYTTVAWGSGIAATGAAEIKDDKTDYWTWKDTWKIIGNAGMVGGAISAVGNLITGGTDGKNILSSLKFVSSIIGNGASAVKEGADAAWRYFVGWQKPLLKLDKSSFMGTVKSSFHKQFIDDLGFNGASTTADKVKVGTKWAGHILTLGSNALENYSEFEGQGTMGAIRGTTETVVETAVDIGLGALATAAVSAGAVALGFVGAPALVIGAGAAAVTWAANGVCKWLTGGKDIGEVVADAVWDIGEGAVNLAKQGLEKAGEIAHDIGEGIKDVGENIKNGLSTAWNGLCSIFG